MTSPDSDNKEIRISSQLQEICGVQQRILAEMAANHYGDGDSFGVQLALEEALKNAIVHGNGSDAAKQVRVAFHVDETQVWIEIEDEGKGFDLEKVVDPTLPENVEQLTGRGLHLMQAYMNEIEYNEVGNCITMCRHRE